MTPIFLDTVGLVALWDRDDQWHAVAEDAYTRVVSARQPVTTTAFISCPVLVSHCSADVYDPGRRRNYLLFTQTPLNGRIPRPWEPIPIIERPSR